jgi:hypothetical protein
MSNSHSIETNNVCNGPGVNQSRPEPSRFSPIYSDLPAGPDYTEPYLEPFGPLQTLEANQQLLGDDTVTSTDLWFTLLENYLASFL